MVKCKVCRYKRTCDLQIAATTSALLTILVIGSAVPPAILADDEIIACSAQTSLDLGAPAKESHIEDNRRELCTAGLQPFGLIILYAANNLVCTAEQHLSKHQLTLFRSATRKLKQVSLQRMCYAHYFKIMVRHSKYDITLFLLKTKKL